MSLERGGRADKYGNEYENQQLARLFLSLANEKLSSVMVEPIDKSSDAYEFVSEAPNGDKIYYQCKSSNNTKNSWTIADLQNYHVFDRIKDLLIADSNAQYQFISPLSYRELDEICKRARTCNDPAYFEANVTTNSTIQKCYNDVKQALNIENTVLIALLSRCFFEQMPYTESQTTQLEEIIDLTFTGDAYSARILLENYANSTGKYGIKITSKDIIDYMATSDHHFRYNIHDDRLSHKIDSLNTNHWENIPGINNQFLHRDITDTAIQEIQNGHSLIIHGKAGAGKSGCLQEIKNHLSANNTLYLSVKLDKHIPTGTADQFGQSLDLPESPIYSLMKLSAGYPCVLILDQLDSLRWTSNHSKASLEVCKELISQAHAANKYQNAKIIIVFATRTFDLEYDPGLRQLFDDKDTKNSISWVKLHVDYFTESEVVQLIGSEYRTFPLKLKKLLRTPASLYIWSKLSQDHRQPHISSLRELISKWWDQIIQSCLKVGIDRRDAISCRDKIVTYMERTSTLSINKRYFTDDESIIEMFISCGMLHEQNSLISFVHQSFLDHFVCSNKIDQIVLHNKNLPELIGTYDKQTPNIRYRLQTVLQELIDTNISIFLAQASLIMESEQVHDYLKCCIFELIGQYDEPDTEIFSFIEKYIQLSKWEEYIYRTVYYGHPVYVRYFYTSHNVNWLEGKPSTMLRSIAEKESLFIAQVLRPYINVSVDDDKKVYNALPYDISNEAEQTYELRLELLNKYPELIDGYFLFHDMFTKQSIRALDLFIIILNNIDTFHFPNMYFDKDKSITLYIQKFYKDIVCRLFPLICEKTKDYLPHWFGKHFIPEYEMWIYSDYKESIVRSIVEIVKDSLCEMAKKDSEEFCALLNSISYPFSGIGHELIMSALFWLPETYSDYCINWLLADFTGKVFVFSADISDYLKLATALIKKHGNNCSDYLFESLEQTIYYWHDSKEQIKDSILYRRECRKKYGVAYYTYWGHMQKILLHCMDYQRLSQKARELIMVLDRNEWINTSHFFFVSPMGPAKTVISPIHGHTEKLTNKHWLDIVSISPQSTDKHIWGKETNSNYIESSPFAFASAMGSQAKLEPLRFALLSLQFPDNCYPGYVSHILYALGKNNTLSNTVPQEIVFQIIQKYMHIESEELTSAILYIIEDRSIYNWPQDILEFLKQTALHHKNPDPTDPQWIKSNPSHMSAESLATWSINCIRGEAIHAIGSLLWDHKDLSLFFKSTIQAASIDAHRAVRFSVMSCVLPYYNYDRVFSEQIYKLLIDQDRRILVSNESRQLIFYTIGNDYDWYCHKIEDALETKIEDLSNDLAGLYGLIAIQRHDNSIIERLLQHQLSIEQQNSLIRDVVHMLSNLQYHDICIELFSRIITNSIGDFHSLSALFYHDRISIEKDADFLIKVLEHSQGTHVIHSFLEFAKNADSDLRSFAPLFQTISNEIAINPHKWGNMYWLDDFIACVIRLFDTSGNDATIRSICLDIWDKVYLSNLQGLKSISTIMEEYES